MIEVSSLDSDEVISGHFHLFKDSFFFGGITEAYKNRYNSKDFNASNKKYPANKMTTFRYNPYERNNCLESIFVVGEMYITKYLKMTELSVIKEFFSI